METGGENRKRGQNPKLRAFQSPFTPDELRTQVNTIIERAAVYQLTSQQQVCRFMNLAATYGWEFDSDPDLLWMRSILTDTSLAHPSERLDRLVQSCLHRDSIEDHNQAMRLQLGLAPVAGARAPERAQAEDYARQKHLAHPQPAAVGTEDLITRTPLSYHLSQSLWHGPEVVPAERPSPAAPTWMNNTPALLRQRTGGRHVRGK